MDRSKKKSRRSSILKPPKARTPLQDVNLLTNDVSLNTTRTRRVSFSGTQIKEFHSDAETVTVWGSSYEGKLKLDSSSTIDSIENPEKTTDHINNIIRKDDQQHASFQSSTSRQNHCATSKSISDQENANEIKHKRLHESSVSAQLNIRKKSESVIKVEYLSSVFNRSKSHNNTLCNTASYKNNKRYNFAPDESAKKLSDDFSENISDVDISDEVFESELSKNVLCSSRPFDDAAVNIPRKNETLNKNNVVEAPCIINEMKQFKGFDQSEDKDFADNDHFSNFQHIDQDETASLSKAFRRSIVRHKVLQQHGNINVDNTRCTTFKPAKSQKILNDSDMEFTTVIASDILEKNDVLHINYNKQSFEQNSPGKNYFNDVGFIETIGNPLTYGLNNLLSGVQCNRPVSAICNMEGKVECAPPMFYISKQNTIHDSFNYSDMHLTDSNRREELNTSGKPKILSVKDILISNKGINDVLTDTIEKQFALTNKISPIGYSEKRGFKKLRESDHNKNSAISHLGVVKHEQKVTAADDSDMELTTPVNIWHENDQHCAEHKIDSKNFGKLFDINGFDQKVSSYNISDMDLTDCNTEKSFVSCKSGIDNDRDMKFTGIVYSMPDYNKMNKNDINYEYKYNPGKDIDKSRTLAGNDSDMELTGVFCTKSTNNHTHYNDERCKSNTHKLANDSHVSDMELTDVICAKLTNNYALYNDERYKENIYYSANDSHGSDMELTDTSTKLTSDYTLYNDKRYKNTRYSANDSDMELTDVVCTKLTNDYIDCSDKRSKNARYSANDSDMELTDVVSTKLTNDYIDCSDKRSKTVCYSANDSDMDLTDVVSTKLTNDYIDCSDKRSKTVCCSANDSDMELTDVVSKKVNSDYIHYNDKRSKTVCYSANDSHGSDMELTAAVCTKLANDYPHCNDERYKETTHFSSNLSHGSDMDLTNVVYSELNSDYIHYDDVRCSNNISWSTNTHQDSAVKLSGIVNNDFIYHSSKRCNENTGYTVTMLNDSNMELTGDAHSVPEIQNVLPKNMFGGILGSGCHDLKGGNILHINDLKVNNDIEEGNVNPVVRILSESNLKTAYTMTKSENIDCHYNVKGNDTSVSNNSDIDCVENIEKKDNINFGCKDNVSSVNNISGNSDMEITENIPEHIDENTSVTVKPDNNENNIHRDCINNTNKCIIDTQSSEYTHSESVDDNIIASAVGVCNDSSPELHNTCSESTDKKDTEVCSESDTSLTNVVMTNVANDGTQSKSKYNNVVINSFCTENSDFEEMLNNKGSNSGECFTYKNESELELTKNMTQPVYKSVHIKKFDLSSEKRGDSVSETVNIKADDGSMESALVMRISERKESLLSNENSHLHNEVSLNETASQINSDSCSNAGRTMVVSKKSGECEDNNNYGIVMNFTMTEPVDSRGTVVECVLEKKKITYSVKVKVKSVEEDVTSSEVSIKGNLPSIPDDDNLQNQQPLKRKWEETQHLMDSSIPPDIVIRSDEVSDGIAMDDSLNACRKDILVSSVFNCIQSLKKFRPSGEEIPSVQTVCDAGMGLLENAEESINAKDVLHPCLRNTCDVSVQMDESCQTTASVEDTYKLLMAHVSLPSDKLQTPFLDLKFPFIENNKKDEATKNISSEIVNVTKDVVDDLESISKSGKLSPSHNGDAKLCSVIEDSSTHSSTIDNRAIEQKNIFVKEISDQSKICAGLIKSNSGETAIIRKCSVLSEISENSHEIKEFENIGERMLDSEQILSNNMTDLCEDIAADKLGIISDMTREHDILHNADIGIVKVENDMGTLASGGLDSSVLKLSMYDNLEYEVAIPEKNHDVKEQVCKSENRLQTFDTTTQISEPMSTCDSAPPVSEIAVDNDTCSNHLEEQSIVEKFGKQALITMDDRSPSVRNETTNQSKDKDSISKNVSETVLLLEVSSVADDCEEQSMQNILLENKTNLKNSFDLTEKKENTIMYESCNTKNLAVTSTPSMPEYDTVTNISNLEDNLESSSHTEISENILSNVLLPKDHSVIDERRQDSKDIVKQDEKNIENSTESNVPAKIEHLDESFSFQKSKINYSAGQQQYEVIESPLKIMDIINEPVLFCHEQLVRNVVSDEKFLSCISSTENRCSSVANDHASSPTKPNSGSDVTEDECSVSGETVLNNVCTDKEKENIHLSLNISSMEDHLISDNFPEVVQSVCSETLVGCEKENILSNVLIPKDQSLPNGRRQVDKDMVKQDEKNIENSTKNKEVNGIIVPANIEHLDDSISFEKYSAAQQQYEVIESPPKVMDIISTRKKLVSGIEMGSDNIENVSKEDHWDYQMLTLNENEEQRRIQSPFVNPTSPHKVSVNTDRSLVEHSHLSSFICEHENDEISFQNVSSHVGKLCSNASTLDFESSLSKSDPENNSDMSLGILSLCSVTEDLLPMELEVLEKSSEKTKKKVNFDSKNTVDSSSSGMYVPCNHLVVAESSSIHKDVSRHKNLANASLGKSQDVESLQVSQGINGVEDIYGFALQQCPFSDTLKETTNIYSESNNVSGLNFVNLNSRDENTEFTKEDNTKSMKEVTPEGTELFQFKRCAKETSLQFRNCEVPESSKDKTITNDAIGNTISHHWTTAEREIKEASEDENCLWSLKLMCSFKWIFQFMFDSIDLVVEFENDDSKKPKSVSKVYLFSRVTDKTDQLVQLAHTHLLSRFNSDILEKLCSTEMDVLNILQMVSTSVDRMLTFMLDFDFLETTNVAKLIGNRVSLQFESMKLLLSFTVFMDVSNWEEISPSDITVHANVGDVDETDIKRLLLSVRKHSSHVLHEYVKVIKKYIRTVELYS